MYYLGDSLKYEGYIYVYVCMLVDTKIVVSHAARNKNHSYFELHLNCNFQEKLYILTFYTSARSVK